MVGGTSNLVEIRAVAVEQHQQQYHQAPPPFVLQKGNVLEIVPKDPTPGQLQQVGGRFCLVHGMTGMTSLKTKNDLITIYQQLSTPPTSADSPTTVAILPVPAPVAIVEPPSAAAVAAQQLALERRQCRKAERNRRRMDKFMRNEMIRVRIRNLCADHAELDDAIRAAMSAANGVCKREATAVVDGMAEQVATVAASADGESVKVKLESPDADDVRDQPAQEGYKRARYNPLAPVGKSCLRQPARSDDMPKQLAAATADGPEVRIIND